MWLPHSLTQQLHHEGRWIPFFSFLFFQMFHSKFFIECRQTCCAAKWKYNIIKIRHAIKLASVLMNITDLKQPLTNGISCLWRHFNKLLSSDINFHQDPTCHEINEKSTSQPCYDVSGMGDHATTRRPQLIFKNIYLKFLDRPKQQVY